MLSKLLWILLILKMAIKVMDVVRISTNPNPKKRRDPIFMFLSIFPPGVVQFELYFKKGADFYFKIKIIEIAIIYHNIEENSKENSLLIGC
jgi:hypothetical protein